MHYATYIVKIKDKIEPREKGPKEVKYQIIDNFSIPCFYTDKIN